jgi:hypothetical protein
MIDPLKRPLKPILSPLVQNGVRKYRVYKNLFYFAVRQRRLDFQIGEQPWLDEDSSAAFLRMLENCNGYLEYGSGGSTVFKEKYLSIADTPVHDRRLEVHSVRKMH